MRIQILSNFRFCLTIDCSDETLQRSVFIEGPLERLREQDRGPDGRKAPQEKVFVKTGFLILLL